ncbi:MAG: tRNA guanosine(34) transglycosylase Tgt [Pirellulales bacterium]|nr:tRNA guanosine(34) transglycosylase Tgt [Pirellulales bacterium]
MNAAHFTFSVHHRDAGSAARRSTLQTSHGPVEMPAFMPVGTQGTVKGITVDQLSATGAHMILGNTYHLTLRPGEEIVAELGGLHAFMGWPGPILTDSGGFQIFSLAQRARISEQSAVFRSHIDGSVVELSPERAVKIQETLGSDIAMVLDHVVALPNTRDKISEAMQRSVRWAERCRKAASRPEQAQFAIVQGGLDIELRLQCTEKLLAIGFDGYAVGGLSVGETPDEMYHILSHTVAALPADKPRYLMGVGRPEDLLEAVGHGIDMFDCVMPTRNGRNALAFTDQGVRRLRNLKYQRDDRPLEEGCPCPACRHSRGYLRHLFMAGEMLGPILLTAHNLTYYQRVMADAREAIAADRFVEYRQAKHQSWAAGDEAASPEGASER